jgi:hypothetical protein
MDEVDLTERVAETLLSAQISNSVRPVPIGKPTGLCWQRGKAVEMPRRWCGAACRDDWQAENNLTRTGK